MMNIVVLIILISLLISMLLFFLSMFFVENMTNEVSETMFECGFEPIFFSRVPFSMHFFTITIVFLIFDLEVVIILPILLKITNLKSVLFMTVMISLLMLGLMIEWFDSSVSWQM